MLPYSSARHGTVYCNASQRRNTFTLQTESGSTTYSLSTGRPWDEEMKDRAAFIDITPEQHVADHPLIQPITYRTEALAQLPMRLLPVSGQHQFLKRIRSTVIPSICQSGFPRYRSENGEMVCYRTFPLPNLSGGIRLSPAGRCNASDKHESTMKHKAWFSLVTSGYETFRLPKQLIIPRPLYDSCPPF